MVTITNHILAAELNAIVQEVARRAQVIPGITPRSLKQLLVAAKHDDLVIASDSGKIIGWMLVSSFGRYGQEIGMGYVEPGYRRRKVLTQLIDQVIDKRTYCVAATYEKGLAEHLEKTWGFKRTTLGSIVILTKGRFLTRRLRSLWSVRAHMSNGVRPMLLVRESDGHV